MKLLNFFLVKKLNVRKARFFPKFFWENCFLCSRYGAGTERNFSKVGTGTVKNCYTAHFDNLSLSYQVWLLSNNICEGKDW
jgi:hypothetical protein